MQRIPLVNSSSPNQVERRDNRLGKRPVSSSLAPTVPALTPAQMYSNFEEWIKMCTDNVSFFSSSCLQLDVLTQL